MTLAHRPFRPDDFPIHAFARLTGGVVCLEEIDSTNAFLAGAARAGGDGQIAIAESQTAGRGRFGRRWTAPRGAGVLMSVLVREPADSALRKLGGAVGAVAAIEAIRSLTDSAPSIRWPNDVTIAGAKVAGVLAEVVALSATQIGVIIGVGVNCLQQRAHFPDDLREKATSLEIESTAAIDRHAVGAALATHLDRWLAATRQADFAVRLLANWRAACRDIGSRVTLRQNGRTFAGVIDRIEGDAALIVRLDDGGERRFEPETTTRIWPTETPGPAK